MSELVDHVRPGSLPPWNEPFSSTGAREATDIPTELIEALADTPPADTSGSLVGPVLSRT